MDNNRNPKRKFLTAVSALAAALTTSASLAAPVPTPETGLSYPAGQQGAIEFIIAPADQVGIYASGHQSHQSHQSHSSHSSHQSHQSHHSHYSGI